MIRWGVIGLGKIAERFCNSLDHSVTGTLVAVASRQADKRAVYEQRYPGIKAYATYEHLFWDEMVDAIYIAVPHSLHKELSIKALNNGKAVLCEKPMTLCRSEAKEIISCAKKNQVFFMEAMKTKFVPFMDTIKSDLADGIIGDITHLKASFSSKLDDSVLLSSRYIAEPNEGGALLDVGSYAVSFALDLLGIPEQIESRQVNAENGLNLHSYMKFIYASGAVAELEAGLDLQMERTAVICGTQGKMEIPIWNRPTKYIARLSDGRCIEQESPLIIDDMFGEIEEVNRCVRLGMIESPRHSFDDMLLAMDMIDKVCLECQ